MQLTLPYRVKTIAEYHKLIGVAPPVNPLISVIAFEQEKQLPPDKPKTLCMDFYCIALKRDFNYTMKYGQHPCDFNNGILFFMAPGQILSIESDTTVRHAGWLVLVHPDFLMGTSLAESMRRYEFFNYSVKEALHVSEDEEITVSSIVSHIAKEQCSNTDGFSKNLMIAQLELLLTYSERFYHRQFLTRKAASHDILTRFETALDERFRFPALELYGLPTVQQLADALYLSANYLSNLLKVLTGRNAQQHIHNRLLAIAKEQLSTTSLSVNEIAYTLGFEHPQSFSKFFKSKTSFSPVAFRKSIH